jgi:hypothetical protein
LLLAVTDQGHDQHHGERSRAAKRMCVVECLARLRSHKVITLASTCHHVCLAVAGEAAEQGRLWAESWFSEPDCDGAAGRGGSTGACAGGERGESEPRTATQRQPAPLGYTTCWLMYGNHCRLSMAH